MNRTNAINHSFTGTSSARKIIPRNNDREYICFYAVSGDCEIVIGSNDFTTNAITLPEGVMWEPEVTLTGDVWFLGNASKLTVLY